jgi:hypothetical protein
MHAEQRRIFPAIPLMWVSFVMCDRLRGLVVRVPGYRSRGPGLDSRRCQIL